MGKKKSKTTCPDKGNLLQNEHIEIMLHLGTPLISFPNQNKAICLSVYRLEMILDEDYRKCLEKVEITHLPKEDTLMERAKLISLDVAEIIKKNNLP